MVLFQLWIASLFFTISLQRFLCEIPFYTFMTKGKKQTNKQTNKPKTKTKQNNTKTKTKNKTKQNKKQKQKQNKNKNKTKKQNKTKQNKTKQKKRTCPDFGSVFYHVVWVLVLVSQYFPSW